MRLSWQAEWVKWENNTSCRHVILQVKIGLMKNILFKKKKSRHTQKNCHFQTHIFQNTFILLASLLSWSRSNACFFFGCCCYVFKPKTKLEQEKVEKMIAAQEGLNFCQFVCMTMHERWQRDGNTALRKGRVRCHDLSLDESFSFGVG